MKKAARIVIWIVASLLLIYLAIAVTPLRYWIIRIDPDIGRIAFPPFFYYTREFNEGNVGPANIGQDISSFRSALVSRYGDVEMDARCLAYQQPETFIRGGAATCFRTKSRISRYPILWLVGHRGEIVEAVRVTTDFPQDS